MSDDLVVDLSDVEALLGRDLTSAEQDRATRLLEMAQAALEDALPGFSAAPGSETADVWPRGDATVGTDGTIWTPRYPVTAVTAITVLGAAIPTLGWRFTEAGQIVFAPWDEWLPVINAPWVARGFTPYAVTYNFGLDPLPADLAAAVAAPVAAIVRQQATNPDDLTRESIGSYQIFYRQRGDGDPVAIGPIIADAVRVALRRWRRTRQLSVPIARHL